MHGMQKKAFVLLSGGLDSTTCLYKAIYDYAPAEIPIYSDQGIVRTIIDGLHAGEAGSIDWVEAVSINYGQKHLKETEYALATCKRLGIRHTTLNLGGLLSGEGVMLTDPGVTIPDKSYADIKGVSPTYVPYRNGTMLSVIAAYAQKWVNEQIEAYAIGNENTSDISYEELKEHGTTLAKDLCGIYFGAHSEDAQNWAYPDCTPEFIGAMANAIYVGTYNTIRLHTPLQWLKKAEIVELGDKLGVPFENTWSCYAGGENHCGKCPTCRSRKEAFEIAGVMDPTDYET